MHETLWFYAVVVLLLALCFRVLFTAILGEPLCGLCGLARCERGRRACSVCREALKLIEQVEAKSGYAAEREGR